MTDLQALKKATENRDPEEMFRLAEKYYSEGDYCSAADMYRAAAWKDHALAQARLGDAYLKGEGVSKNNANAYKWYHKSAMQGCPYGCMRLAHCYRHGLGDATRDYDKAFKLDMYAAEGPGERRELLLLWLCGGEKSGACLPVA